MNYRAKKRIHFSDAVVEPGTILKGGTEGDRYRLYSKMGSRFDKRRPSDVFGLWVVVTVDGKARFVQFDDIEPA